MLVVALSTPRLKLTGKASVGTASSKVLDQWAYWNGVELDFIRPGKPNENAFIESFNGRLREECLNDNQFLTLVEAQTIIEAWRRDYNEERPHGSLNGLTPREFAERHKAISAPEKNQLIPA